MCLVVGGEFFYEEIDGFTHEPGYEYRLRVERYDAFPGQKEPPQDVGKYGYRLLEVLFKNTCRRLSSGGNGCSNPGAMPEVRRGNAYWWIRIRSAILSTVSPSSPDSIPGSDLRVTTRVLGGYWT